MSIWNYIKEQIISIANISNSIDKEAAARDIKDNIYFRGPNAWILGFSILIASAGLNINSIPVIIGAMLISPLMGPIIGLGFGLGTNDTQLLKGALKNLLVMVIISLIVSYFYFLISPLNLANPTELESRTNPTIYDVIIALFGGFAGIFEQCRIKKGNVISGVAIATALMPPLCTAGYGLAHLNFGFFFGALFLFFINSVFISLATYITVKYMRFQNAKFENEIIAHRTKKLITIISLAIILPSLWSAVLMIKHNNFERNVSAFINDNRDIGDRYIYDYKITTGKKDYVNLYIAGEALDEPQKLFLLSTAKKYGLDSSQVHIREHNLGKKVTDTEKFMKGIYERTDSEISKKEAQIAFLESKLSEMKAKEIPYKQISEEIISQHPEIKKVYIAKGEEFIPDSTHMISGILVLADYEDILPPETENSLKNWLKVRLHEEHIIFIARHIETKSIENKDTE